jgi:hypothetical protein
MVGALARLEVGSSGEFSVWVDGAKVIEKSGGRFPDPADIIAAIQRAGS